MKKSKTEPLKERADWGLLDNMHWSENDNLFLGELKNGFDWQSLPALFFKLHGLDVEMPNLKIRPSIKVAHNWLNETDLIVNGRFIEVKSRNEKFTTPKSFPYPTIFVDTVSGYNAKNEKPIAYVMISRPTGNMLCVRADNPGGWAINKRFDNVRKIWDDFYLSPKERLQTLDVLVKFLKN